MIASKAAKAAVLLGLSLVPFPSARSAEAKVEPPFEFREGDRIVLVGDTLIEREQTYGFWEARITSQFPGRHFVFRNLGWSADTPAGESRASFDFDKPGKGFEKLKEQLVATQPTVVMVGYGMSSSFDGQAGLEKFRKDLDHLLDTIHDCNSNGPVRVVLLTPIRHEDLGRPLPDPSSHNKKLQLYCDALKQVAQKRQCKLISLFDAVPGHNTRPATQNGIHLSEYGYWRESDVLAAAFGWRAEPWSIIISSDGRLKPPGGTEITKLERKGDSIRFEARDRRLSLGLKRSQEEYDLSPKLDRRLQIEGLGPGIYQLKIDGSMILAANDRDWARGVALDRGPALEQAEALRQAILKKNTLYFDRWRPQNETYLLGFRKQEQGQNAKEIPMFDPLIAAEEQKIFDLARPRSHSFELVRVADRRDTMIVSMKKGELSEPVESVSNSKAGPLTPEPVFEVAPGFTVSLYAESPLLAKPTQMNFDPQGRLWISSSSVYPQIQPGQVADDKILVLEDTDGDGYAEKSTVFADGLLIPTGVVPGDGGCYVGQSTELLHFKDTDGDGKADRKRIVLSGFGTEDTHHMVHTLHWGMDGQLYFNQSIYIHTHIETPNGVRHLNSGGTWHLRPPTMELGVFLRGFCNPWGHEFDAFGQSFLTDGAGYQGISYGVPGATYFTYADMRRELKSISPGNYPKFCGLEIVRTPQFPDDWQGAAITCDFRAHRVVRFSIEEQGSGFAAKEVADFLRTTNVTFRPIDVKLGPDGALYIADWSNPIIQHGEVDFRDPRRDHEHGRIWRVVAQGRPLVPRVNLPTRPTRELLDNLLSPSAPVVEQSRRVLAERGEKILPELRRWTSTHASDHELLQALWTYQSINVVEPKLLDRALRAKDGRIRAAATRVLSFWYPRLAHPEVLLAARMKDEHPRVRLEAIRAMAQEPTLRSADLVLSALDEPMDPFLDYAVWLSINELADPWIEGVKSGAWKSAGREKQLEFALRAIQPAKASTVLAQVLHGKEIARDGSGPWIKLIGVAGDETLLRKLFDQVLRDDFDDATTTRALAALNTAAHERGLKPSGQLDALAPLLKHQQSKIQEQALSLAGSWKLKGFITDAARVAADPSSPENTRSAAFETLRNIGGSEVVGKLKELSGKDHDLWGRRKAVLTLAGLNLRAAGPLANEVLLELKTDQEAIEFWQSLLAVKGAGPEMARVLPKTGLSPVVARAGLRAARTGGRNEPDLVWALTRGADLEGEAQTLSLGEMQALAADVLKVGNAVRGETIFRRKDAACFTCHAIGGVGGKVGPDLTSIGASAPPDYLIESVLYPNRKIKEGYHSVIIETKDGLDLSGVLVSENSEQLVLRDATGKETTILKNNIQTRATGNSLMPAGLVDPLSPAERLDLYRFLSELGKPGPFDASKGNVARAWKILAQSLDLAQFGDDKVLGTDLADKQWLPAVSLVDGRLVKDDLIAALEPVKDRDPRAIYAAARFQSVKSGKISFKLTGSGPAQVWIDRQGCQGGDEPSAELEPGPHTIVVKLDAKKVPAAIRLESPDVTFLN